jgi:hypothetical protein
MSLERHPANMFPIDEVGYVKQDTFFMYEACNLARELQKADRGAEFCMMSPDDAFKTGMHSCELMLQWALAGDKLPESDLPQHRLDILHKIFECILNPLLADGIDTAAALNTIQERYLKYYRMVHPGPISGPRVPTNFTAVSRMLRKALDYAKERQPIDDKREDTFYAELEKDEKDAGSDLESCIKLLTPTIHWNSPTNDLHEFLRTPYFAPCTKDFCSEIDPDAASGCLASLLAVVKCQVTGAHQSNILPLIQIDPERDNCTLEINVIMGRMKIDTPEFRLGVYKAKIEDQHPHDIPSGFVPNVEA